MAASTAAREASKKPGDIAYYNVGASTTINKGTLVVTRGDGFVYPLRAPAVSQPDVFVGIAYETVNNSAGSAGALGIRVYRRGSFVLNMASPTAAAVVGQALYGLDDQDVTATSTNAVQVGYGVDVEPGATSVRVQIDISVR